MTCTTIGSRKFGTSIERSTPTRCSGRLDPAGRDDHFGALAFVRRALNQDPWRETLSGGSRVSDRRRQRSAAIETYLQCRARALGGPGLEPSAETRALYDQILAMEDRPCTRTRVAG